MSIEQTDGIVLKSVDFSETSLILSIYTQNFGKINAIAKGGRRLKSPFETSLDVLAHVRLGVLRKKNDSLDILTESKLIQRFCPHSHNLAGLYAGYILVDLIQELTENGEPNPPLFFLIKATLEDFAIGSFVQRSLIRFEWRMLDLLGMKPVLDRCVECERQLPDIPRSVSTVASPPHKHLGFSDSACSASEISNHLKHTLQHRVSFSPLNGGILCSRCRIGATHLLSVRQSTLTLLRQLIQQSSSLEEEFQNRMWTQMSIDKSALGEIRRLTTHTVSHLAERRPELYSYLGVVSRFDRE
ncbi:MAG: DNA repair protein RecO [Thermoguttaceae bacterium]